MYQPIPKERSLTTLDPKTIWLFEVAPKKGVKRPPCPFYGFNLLMGYFLDTEGNQCALRVNRFSPCPREVHEGRTPNIYYCQDLYSPPGLRAFTRCDELIVFPGEFPIGLSLREWMGYLNKLNGIQSR